MASARARRAAEFALRPWWAALAARCYAHTAYQTGRAPYTGTRPIVARVLGGATGAVSLLLWSGSTAVYSTEQGGRVTFEIWSYPGLRQLALAAAPLIPFAVLMPAADPLDKVCVAAAGLLYASVGGAHLVTRPTLGNSLISVLGVAVAIWIVMSGMVAGVCAVLLASAVLCQLPHWFILRWSFRHFRVRPHRYVTTVARWRDGPGVSESGDFALAWAAFGRLAANAAWTVGLDADDPRLRDDVYIPVGLTPEPGGAPLRLTQRFGDSEPALPDQA